MSLEGSFEIRNKMEGFRFFLFLSGDNNECVIAQDDGATDNLTRIIQPVGGGMMQIRSKVGNRSLGFTGTPTSGTPVIVVDDDNAKTWQVIWANEPEYHFIVPGTSSPSLVIQFPSNNLQAGTPTELGKMLPGEGPNQVWLVIPRESLSQQSSSFLEYRGDWIVVVSGW